MRKGADRAAGVTVRPSEGPGLFKGRGLKILRKNGKREMLRFQATRVFDSWALLAFLEDEPSAGKVEDLIAQANDPEVVC